VCPDESPRSLAPALVVASLLHVASIVGLYAFMAAMGPWPSTMVKASDGLFDIEQEVEVITLDARRMDEKPRLVGRITRPEESPRDARPASPGLQTVPRSSEIDTRSEGSTPGVGGSEPSAEDGERPYSLDPNGRDPSAGGDAYGPMAGGFPGLPGLPGTPVWMFGPGSYEGPAPAPTTTPKRRFDPHAATRALDATMLRLDADKGLLPPATSLVAAALEEAAMQTPMPSEAQGTFAVSFTEVGKVGTIRVTTFTAGKRSAWDAVVRLAFSKVAGKALDIGRLKPPFSFAVRLTTEVLYPSGAKEPTELVDVGVSPRQVVHAFVQLRGAGTTALPSEIPSQKERGPWNQGLPKGVMPVELNPDKR